MIVKPLLECKGVEITLNMDEVEREAANPSVLQAELQGLHAKWKNADWSKLQARVVEAKKTEACPFCDRRFSNKHGVSMHIVQMRRHGHEDHGSDDGHGGWN